MELNDELIYDVDKQEYNKKIPKSVKKAIKGLFKWIGLPLEDMLDFWLGFVSRRHALKYMLRRREFARKTLGAVDVLGVQNIHVQIMDFIFPTKEMMDENRFNLPYIIKVMDNSTKYANMGLKPLKETVTSSKKMLSSKLIKDIIAIIGYEGVLETLFASAKVTNKKENEKAIKDIFDAKIAL